MNTRARSVRPGRALGSMTAANIDEERDMKGLTKQFVKVHRDDGGPLAAICECIADSKSFPWGGLVQDQRKYVAECMAGDDSEEMILAYFDMAVSVQHAETVTRQATERLKAQFNPVAQRVAH
jgi:hypothetical protein